MRVLFAIKTLVHSVGGAEKMVAFLSGAMAARGMDTHLLTFDKPEEPPFYPVDGKVRRHYVPLGDAGRKTTLFDYPSLLWRLRREVVQARPDIVIAFMHSMFVPMQCALLGTGVKVVLSEHTAPAYYDTRRMELWLLRLFALFAYSITIVSGSIRALYPSEMRGKMEILPDPVISDFGAADVEGQSGTRKTLLSVGRLNKDKDHRIMLEAFALLAAEFPEWDVQIAGEGEERSGLEDFARAHTLQERIHLCGAQKDMDSLYKAAQIFVMPSRYESFGLATVEAMSHALPVIGFADCSGTNMLVRQEENGFLVPKRNKEELAQAMRALMASSALRRQYGETGQQDARAYAPENVGIAWEAYITRLVRPLSPP